MSDTENALLAVWVGLSVMFCFPAIGITVQELKYSPRRVVGVVALVWMWPATVATGLVYCLIAAIYSIARNQWAWPHKQWRRNVAESVPDPLLAEAQREVERILQ